MNEALEKILAGERAFEPSTGPDPKSLSVLSERPLAVYGLGECAHWFHEIGMKRFGITPVIALDSKPPGSDWWGVETMTAEQFVSSSGLFDPDIEVIVSVGTRATFNAIKASLEELGLRRVHYLHDFYEFQSFFVWDADEIARRMRDNKEKFRKVFPLLADDLSRDIFCKLTQVHVTRMPLDIPASPRDEQYFPSDVPLSKGHGTYVCCGAYDGENVRLLGQKLGQTKEILCFEPEPLIYSALADCARRSTGSVADRIVCFHNAVSDQNGTHPFISGHGLGSRLDRTGEDFAQCVKLDDALAGFTPTFISMDIEGAEVPALRGCNDVIKRYKPDLGICVYHYPEQIAEVIDCINEIESGYQFYVRNYTTYLTETVIYAVCPLEA